MEIFGHSYTVLIGRLGFVIENSFLACRATSRICQIVVSFVQKCSLASLAQCCVGENHALIDRGGDNNPFSLPPEVAGGPLSSWNLDGQRYQSGCNCIISG